MQSPQTADPNVSVSTISQVEDLRWKHLTCRMWNLNWMTDMTQTDKERTTLVLTPGLASSFAADAGFPTGGVLDTGAAGPQVPSILRSNKTSKHAASAKAQRGGRAAAGFALSERCIRH